MSRFCVVKPHSARLCGYRVTAFSMNDVNHCIEMSLSIGHISSPVQGVYNDASFDPEAMARRRRRNAARNGVHANAVPARRL